MNAIRYDPKDIPLPKFGKTALELLDEKTVDPPSLASAYGFQFGCGFIASMAQLTKNWIYRGPLISGIHFYPIYFTMGATAAHYFLQYRKNYWAERDAVMRHYIQLHPEDFPPPERKKYGEVLLKWIPIR